MGFSPQRHSFRAFSVAEQFGVFFAVRIQLFLFFDFSYAEKIVNAYVVIGRDSRQQRYIRVSFFALPFGDRLGGNAEMVRQILLRVAFFSAELF